MPRGKYVNHKGRSRHFTSPEELQQENDEESSEENTSSDADGDATAGTSKSATKSKERATKKKVEPASSSEADSDEESSEDDRDAKKGVASLIEIENPNRAVKKSSKKLGNLTLDDKETDEAAKPTLTRREREQIEKQKALERYEKLHAQGKTSQAKADLARLALIRQQRAEAAAKRDAEKKAIEVKKTGGDKA